MYQSSIDGLWVLWKLRCDGGFLWEWGTPILRRFVELPSEQNKPYSRLFMAKDSSSSHLGWDKSSCFQDHSTQFHVLSAPAPTQHNCTSDYLQVQDGSEGMSLPWLVIRWTVDFSNHFQTLNVWEPGLTGFPRYKYLHLKIKTQHNTTVQPHSNRFKLEGANNSNQHQPTGLETRTRQPSIPVSGVPWWKTIRWIHAQWTLTLVSSLIFWDLRFGLVKTGQKNMATTLIAVVFFEQVIIAIASYSKGRWFAQVFPKLAWPQKRFPT